MEGDFSILTNARIYTLTLFENANIHVILNIESKTLICKNDLEFKDENIEMCHNIKSGKAVKKIQDICNLLHLLFVERISLVK